MWGPDPLLGGGGCVKVEMLVPVEPRGSLFWGFTCFHILGTHSSLRKTPDPE